MTERKLLFIVNPCAGMKKVAGYLSEIIQVFCAHKCVPTVLMTEYAGHAKEMSAKYASDYDLVVCAGGDGTLNETISGLLEKGINKPVGYLPCGTTNDLGSTLGLSRSLVRAATDAVTGTERYIDIGSFNGRNFVYTASFGAFTKASYETPQNAKNVLGHLAYLLEGAKGLGQLKPTYARIVTDTETLEGEYLFGSVSNTTSLAGIITIDKGLVLLDDGKFELLLVDMPKNALEFSRLLINLTQQRFGEMLHLYNVSSMRMETNEAMDWTLDGELEKSGCTAEIQNMTRAVRIIVPNEEEK